MTKHNIPTIFINFEKMISDSKYLYNILHVILNEKNISYELFNTIYEKVSDNSKPKN